MSYNKIKQAAEYRQSGDSTGAWKLADALLAEIPHMPMGPTGESSSDVTTRLTNVAERLASDGVETPSGNAYTAVSLRELRLVAMGWPQATRLDEAAFRTHQECGTSDEWKREVLRVLCLAARLHDWIKPPMNNGEIDDAAWAQAVKSIEKKVTAGTRYSVSANDLRIALHRKVNVPPKDLDQDATALDAIEFMQEGDEKLERAVTVLARKGPQIEDVREAVEALIESLLAKVDMLRAILTSGGVSDEALTELIERES